MKKIIVVFVLLFTLQSYAQDLNTFFKKADVFFKDHVSNGKIAYRAIHNNQDDLNELLSLAEGISVLEKDANNYQAFWINAYNLSVIKGIVDNYPIKSPLDKAGFFDKIKYSLAGKKVTLNTIENKLLRAKFSDARFHFVLVCGAVGCPPLINNAYMPNTLNSQLEIQTNKALNNDLFIKVTNGKVALSEIFKWYKEDFVKKGQTEIDFLNKYRAKAISKDLKVTYYSYNWRLNSK